jgi:hypothetical protein
LQLIFFFIVGLGGGILWHLQNSYNVLNISDLNSPAHCSPLSSPWLHSWNSLKRHIFYTYIHVNTMFAVYSPSYLFPCHLPPPTGTILTPHPGKDLFCPQIHWCFRRKKKKMLFLLLWDKGSCIGVSSWYFHVYMYYNPKIFMSSIFLYSTLVHFLWWFQPV